MSQPLPVTNTFALFCAEEGCQLPWARVQNGCVVVVSNHHGEKHINAIPIDKLYEMCYTEIDPETPPA